MTKINNERLEEICKQGQGEECCRYIVFGPNGFECAKHMRLKTTIDQRVEHMTAQGDNCEGLKGKKGGTDDKGAN